MTAVPNTGYHFVDWSDGVLTAARTDLNVMANVNATANFAIDTFTLTYTAGAGGTITAYRPKPSTTELTARWSRPFRTPATTSSTGRRRSHRDPALTRTLTPTSLSRPTSPSTLRPHHHQGRIRHGHYLEQPLRHRLRRRLLRLVRSRHDRAPDRHPFGLLVLHRLERGLHGHGKSPADHHGRPQDAPGHFRHAHLHYLRYGDRRRLGPLRRDHGRPARLAHRRTPPAPTPRPSTTAPPSPSPRPTPTTPSTRPPKPIPTSQPISLVRTTTLRSSFPPSARP